MRARSVRRWLLWSLTGLVALIGLSGLLLLTEIVQTKIARHFLDDFNKNIPGKVTFASVHAGINGELTLTELSIHDANDQEIIGLGKLRTTVDLRALTDDRLHLRRLKLARLRTHLVMDSTGNSNIAAAFVVSSPGAPASESASAWKIFVDKLEVEGDRTRFVYNEQLLLDLDHWNLNGSGSYADRRVSYDIDLRSEPQLSLTANGHAVLENGLLSLQTQITARLDSTITLHLPEPLPALGAVDFSTTTAIRGDSLLSTFDFNSSSSGSVQGNIALADYTDRFHGNGTLRFENLNLASFLDDSRATQLSGGLAFSRTPAADYVNGWDARLTLNNSLAFEQRFTTSLSIVTFDSSALLRGDMQSRGGSADFDLAIGGFDPRTMSVQGKIEARAVDLHQFIPDIPDTLSPLSGSFELDFPSVNPDSLAGQAYLRLNKFSLGRHSLDSAVVSISVDGTHFVADTVKIRLADMRVDGSLEGEIDGDISFSVTGEIPDLSRAAEILTTPGFEPEPLGGSLTCDLTGDASLAGDSLSGLSLRGQVQILQGQYGDYSLDALSLTVNHYTMDDGEYDVALRADRVILGEQRVDSVDIKVDGNLEAFTTSVRAWALGDTLTLQTAFETRLYEESIDLTVEEFAAEVYGAKWNLPYPSDVYLVDDKIELDGLTLASPFGVLRAVGYLQTEGEQDLTLELSGFRIGSLAGLMQTDIPEARVNLRLQIAGFDSALTGDLTVHVDSLSYDDKLISDKIYLNASLQRDQARVRGYSTWYGDTLMVFGGLIPLRLSFEAGLTVLDSLPLRGVARVFEQPLERLNPWLMPGTKTGGNLSADLKVLGTPADPDWEGTFSIRDGRYLDPRLGINYKWIVLDGKLFGDSLIIQQFRATSRGTLTGSGHAIMGFPWPEKLDMKVKFDKFNAMDSPRQKARLSGNIAVAGPFDSLDVQGEVKLEEVVYRISQSTTKEIEEIDLEAYLSELRGDSIPEKGFLLSDLYSGMSHTLRVEIPGNCWVRGGGVNIELYGDLWLYKEKSGDPSINGDIKVKRGTVKFVSRVMEVEQGTIAFTGPLDDPELNITAIDRKILRREDAEIRARLYGPVSDTRIEFSGRLADGTILTPEQVAAALITGTTQINPDRNIQQSAAELAASPLNQIIEQASGLDVFEFRPGEGGLNDLSSGSLEVGTYLTDRLFIRVLQPIETIQSGQEVSIEYQLREWLKLIAEKKGKERSAFDLFVQVEWR